MQYKKTLFTIAALGCLMSSAAWANEAQIRHSITQFLPGARIGEIKKTPFKGIYEVIVDGALTYTNETGQVMFIGNAMDLKNRRNVAADRQAELGRVKFSKLPLADAITIVKGNGKRKLAVFEDAKCPYCHQLEESLKSITNITEYVFLYPIESLHQGTTDLDKRVWCSPNRAAAWQNWMLRNVTPPGASTCQTPINRNQELGKTFDVQGTPTLVFPNGQVVPGAIPAADLEKALNEFNR
jgi:thiol:disulfide interchange protein DsbC